MKRYYSLNQLKKVRLLSATLYFLSYFLFQFVNHEVFSFMWISSFILFLGVHTFVHLKQKRNKVLVDEMSVLHENTGNEVAFAVLGILFVIASFIAYFEGSIEIEFKYFMLVIILIPAVSDAVYLYEERGVK